MISHTMLSGDAPCASMALSMIANIFGSVTDLADTLNSTAWPSADRRSAVSLTTHRSISVTRPYSSAVGKNSSGMMISPSGPTMRMSTFVLYDFVGREVDNGLGVQDEAVVVQGVANAADPGQFFEFALHSDLLVGALGNVLEDNDRTAEPFGHEGGGTVGDRHRRSVAALGKVIGDDERSTVDPNVSEGAVA